MSTAPRSSKYSKLVVWFRILCGANCFCPAAHPHVTHCHFSSSLLFLTSKMLGHYSILNFWIRFISTYVQDQDLQNWNKVEDVKFSLLLWLFLHFLWCRLENKLDLDTKKKTSMLLDVSASSIITKLKSRYITISDNICRKTKN